VGAKAPGGEVIIDVGMVANKALGLLAHFL
jgi:hypothetical protein